MRTQVICNLDLSIWHCAFRHPVSMNDVSILDVSPHFADVQSGIEFLFHVEQRIARKIFDWF